MGPLFGGSSIDCAAPAVSLRRVCASESHPSRAKIKHLLHSLLLPTMCWKCDQTAPACRFFDDPTWMESTRPLPRWPPGKHVPNMSKEALRAATEPEKEKKAADCQAAPPASERERRLAERPESPLSTGTTPPFARFCPARVLCSSIAHFVHRFAHACSLAGSGQGTQGQLCELVATWQARCERVGDALPRLPPRRRLRLRRRFA